MGKVLERNLLGCVGKIWEIELYGCALRDVSESAYRSIDKAGAIKLVAAVKL